MIPREYVNRLRQLYRTSGDDFYADLADQLAPVHDPPRREILLRELFDVVDRLRRTEPQTTREDAYVR